MTEKQNQQLDLSFHALADPARRSMLQRLTRGPASVSELGKPLRMSLPAVVQHVQVLELSGLIRSDKIGRVRMCRLDLRALKAVEHWLSGRRTAALEKVTVP
jgi:DNA-binding transcriptional ArsR family regulator